jgi:hypothetical protein
LQNKIFARTTLGLDVPKCIGAIKQTIMGNPDPDLVNTSFCRAPESHHAYVDAPLYAPRPYVLEKFENHCHAMALYFVFYNFCCVHKTLGATPAMAPGLVDRVLKTTDVVAMIDARETLPVREPYKKKTAEISNGDTTECRHRQA